MHARTLFHKSNTKSMHPGDIKPLDAIIAIVSPSNPIFKSLVGD